MSRLFVDAGMITLAAFISPFRADRDAVRERMAVGDFVEVFIDTPLATCEQRDPKGLYQRARRGLIKDFTGIDSPYEPPEAPELHIANDGISPEEAALRVIRYLQTQDYLPRQNLPTHDEA
ncbi:adenylyl-sulfate kinase [Chromohalobacter israelensis]|uniref:adenylyl-sulfate kinase n=1 Tax=Chromohalobacter israelensis TaxID=141390 RepID=UPI001CC3F5F7|nr:adenylyl-sulfate kinase [Chromohalobacter salexigens]MBZ5874894.1 adenylyl-sulfate kinase [Chromohalobacter salexigens]